ncbi:MAG TPA: hypothetical protein VFR80_04560 [Pyrinomonadaceae bacterium]|nr:hypothetical protein [Pyrinomonadaceae bacterium]
MISLRHIPFALALVLLIGLVGTATAKPRRLPLQIIDQVLQDACSAGCSTEDLAIYKRSLRFETKDLNRDHHPEFLVYIEHRDFCGMSFNCAYWVFRRRRNDYQLIASGYPVLRVARTVTNGFWDLESQGHMGACVLPDGTTGRHFYLTLFKYSGKKYVPREIGEQCRPHRW